MRRNQCHGPLNFDVIIREREGSECRGREGGPEGEGMAVIFGRVNSTAEIMIGSGGGDGGGEERQKRGMDVGRRPFRRRRMTNFRNERVRPVERERGCVANLDFGAEIDPQLGTVIERIIDRGWRAWGAPSCSLE